MTMCRQWILRRVIAATFTAILLLTVSDAKTRWSSLHLVPDADFLGAGQLLLGTDTYIGKADSVKLIYKPMVPLTFGINEWINISVGYAGGVSLGIKSRILGETRGFWPSLAMGVHNLFNHKEAYFFSIDSTDGMDSELFIAFAKTIEPIKTRFHFGLQSIPALPDERYNPYFAVEKYFGQGLYSSLEIFQRYKAFSISFFTNWRFWRNHFELSMGAVDIKSMFFDNEGKFAVAVLPVTPTSFVKPGYMVGLKFNGGFKFGNNKGFSTIEDRFTQQETMIARLLVQVDSLNGGLVKTKQQLDAVKCSLGVYIEGGKNDPTRLQNVMYNKLITLKTINEAEPFDPERVKLLIKEIVSYREKALPPLEAMLLDIKTDRYVRMYCASIIGEIGLKSSSSVLLEILAQSNDPDLKIETLIALGKMKETRALYLMEQLANSPNEALALAAQEVISSLSQQTGVRMPVFEKKSTVPEPTARQPFIETDYIPPKTIKAATVPATMNRQPLSTPPSNEQFDQDVSFSAADSIAAPTGTAASPITTKVNGGMSASAIQPSEKKADTLTQVPRNTQSPDTASTTDAKKKKPPKKTASRDSLNRQW